MTNVQKRRGDARGYIAVDSDKTTKTHGLLRYTDGCTRASLVMVADG